MKVHKEITIYDIARVLNISPSTVSRGLKNHAKIRKETRRKIHATAMELGYQRNKFASNLRQRKTHTLGVIIPRLNSYFMASAIAGIEKVTNKNGYSLIICQSQESGRREAEGINTLFNSRVDGLMVSLALDTKNLDHFKELFSKSIPVVFFDRVFDCPDCVSVVIDNYRAGYESVNHLISQGCRRIFHLGGNLLRNVYADRLKGYKQALADNSISYDDSLVMIGDMSSDAAIAAAEKILSMKKRPDGIFTSNDTTAVEMIVALKSHGIRIPGDIAVAGFNNEPVSRVVEPNLTTVDYPSYEIGEIAATTLINKLNIHSATNMKTIVLDHRLIIRESSLRNSPGIKTDKR